MTFATWFSLFLICLMGASFPGASLAVVLKHTLNNSRLHGVVTGITHALGVGIYALLSVMGVMLLLQKSPLIFNFMTYAGAAYLLWLGYKGLMAKASNDEQATQAIKTSSLINASRDGFMIALLNPKIGLFFLALFSQFVHVDMTFIDKSLFVGTITVVDGGWYVLVALVMSQGKILVWLKRHQVWVERALGAVLILLALKIVMQ